MEVNLCLPVPGCLAVLSGRSFSEAVKGRSFSPEICTFGLVSSGCHPQTLADRSSSGHLRKGGREAAGRLALLLSNGFQSGSVLPRTAPVAWLCNRKYFLFFVISIPP